MSFLVSSLEPLTDFRTRSSKSVDISSGSPALNLIAAFASTRLEIYDARFLLFDRDYKKVVAGNGQYSTVDIGSNNGQQVAVKRSRLLEYPLPEEEERAFEYSLHQMSLEFCILSHETLRTHANIVKLLGAYIDHFSRQPSLGTVMEYSSLGSLRAFLQAQGNTIPWESCFDLAQQVVSGLDALHQLKVCHGDVKMENTLVFIESGRWIVKLSDFGQSVIAARDDPGTLSGFPYGTPLYNAREVRNRTVFDVNEFGIYDALATDIFSFGLLMWEILKSGKCFFEKSWVTLDESPLHLDQMLSHIDGLAPGMLLEHCLTFVAHLDIRTDMHTRICAVFAACLADAPDQRKTSSTVKAILDGENILKPVRKSYFGRRAFICSNVDLSTILAGCEALPNLFFVVANNMPFQVLELASDREVLLGDLPSKLKKRVFEELKLLQSSKQLPSIFRADAAMALSECYALGFGTEHDSTELAYWLNEARILGHEKATAWYHRVCLALDIPISSDKEVSTYQRIEQDLSSLPTEIYLESRIRRLMRAAVLDARKLAPKLDPSNLESTCNYACYEVELFNSGNVDEIGPLHLAAFIGNATSVVELLRMIPVDSVSKKGFCPIHYACIGGHLPILDLLLRYGGCAHMKGLHGITPLHLSIFFSASEASHAAELLLAHGASVDEDTTSMIYWTDNDLQLTGTPLHWAVLTRNRTLVKAFLPHPSTEECLQIAIWRFHWEIVELLLEHLGSTYQPTKDFLDLGTVLRPFYHWIAHGHDRFDVIARTLHCSRSLNLLQHRKIWGLSPLMEAVSNAVVEEDFRLIEGIMSLMTDAEVKENDEHGYTALLLAIPKSTDQMWTGTLKALIGYYTVEELEAVLHLNGSDSHIHFAVSAGSVMATKMLLEKGVNVNQLTAGDLALTPLHLCGFSQQSPDMFQLLVAHGADLELHDDLLDQTPLQVLTTRPLETRDLLNISLQHQKDERLMTETLHSAMWSAITSLQPNHSRAGLEVFKHMLKEGVMFKCINSPDQYGATMLHKAAVRLDRTILKVLLEAGADAGVPLWINNTQVFPLQLACTTGRQHSRRLLRDNSAQSIEAALIVSRELLQWHKATEVNPFSGITVLHLAAHMNIEEEISRLIELDYDLDAKGSWPSLPNVITPLELSREELLDEEAAVKDVLLGFRKSLRDTDNRWRGHA
ncbi:MAG: hypothetical protein M1821_007046 [Bathelium mastoideum]|nr:MAG: hypothetical protein M1821_007046 [Bathelium mastoideum]